MNNGMLAAAVPVRPAIPDDAVAIAALHVLGWREAYHDLLPAKVLFRLSLTRRAERWRVLLNGRDPAWPGLATFVATDPDSPGATAVGFGCCGPQRTPALARQGYGGQVLALYVRQATQRRGVGRGLMAVMAGDLSARGVQGMGLWTLDGDRPARRFSERLGGTRLGRQTSECWGTTLAEVAYGWPDLAGLGGRAAGEGGTAARR